jgi:hypothetical protein
MKTTFLCIALFCYQLSIAQLVNNPLLPNGLKRVSTPKFNIDNITPNTILLPMEFNGADSKAKLVGIKTEEISSISLVYTRYKLSETFNQLALNTQRMQRLYAALPALKSNTAVQWYWVEQTNCDDAALCTDFFHGFVIKLKDKIKFTAPSFITNYIEPAQVFNFSNERDTFYSCKNGTILGFNANCFINPITNKVATKVKLEVMEYNKTGNIIANRLSTICNNQMLETKGMIKVTAYEGNTPLVVNEAKPYTISFKNNNKTDNEFQLFTGENTTNNVTQWNVVNSKTHGKPIPKRNSTTVSEKYFVMDYLRNKDKRIKKYSTRALAITPELMQRTNGNDTIRFYCYNYEARVSKKYDVERLNDLILNPEEEKYKHLNYYLANEAYKYFVATGDIKSIKSISLKIKYNHGELSFESPYYHNKKAKKFIKHLLSLKINIANDKTNLATIKEFSGHVVSLNFRNYFVKTITSEVYNALNRFDYLNVNEAMYSTFATSSLQIINCDRFVKQELITLHLPSNTDNDCLYAIVYKGYNAVTFESNTTSQVGKNKELIVYAINKASNSIAYAEINSNKNHIKPSDFKPCTQTQFDAQIAQLNTPLASN